MADIFSIVSIVCFVLAGICFVGAVALFFALNTRAAYLELRGQPQSNWISENRSKKKKKEKQKSVAETPTSKMNVEDEAVTTLDNGEEVTEMSLMNVYEPGTELMEEDTESITEVQTLPLVQPNDCEEAVTMLLDEDSSKHFVLVKRTIFVQSDEILQ